MPVLAALAAPAPAAVPRSAAVIHVGPMEVRLEMGARRPDGWWQTLYDERAPFRAGGGVLAEYLIGPAVEARLVATLRRFQVLCRTQGAAVRAVATSPFGNSQNAAAIVARIRDELRLCLEVVSPRESARLLCLGALCGVPADQRSLVIDLGSSATDLIYAAGSSPVAIWSLGLDSLRLSEQVAHRRMDDAQAVAAMRGRAEEAAGRLRLARIRGPLDAIATGDVAASVVDFASGGGSAASAEQIRLAPAALAVMGRTLRRRCFDARTADQLVAAAVLLGTIVDRLGLNSVSASPSGLRKGVLGELLSEGGERRGGLPPYRLSARTSREGRRPTTCRAQARGLTAASG